MLYTVGHTKSYEQYFAEQEHPIKLGKGFYNGKPFQGGSIWITREQAQKYLERTGQDDFSVYGVLCAEKDTEIVEEQSFRNLLKDSALVRLLP